MFKKKPNNDSVLVSVSEIKFIDKLKSKKSIIMGAFIIMGLVVLFFATTMFFIPLYNYYSAESLVKSDDFDKAIVVYEKLGDFLDSPDQIIETTYRKAIYLKENGEYDKAIIVFKENPNYKDTPALIDDTNYQNANRILTSQKAVINLEKAVDIFTALSLKNYKDSTSLLLDAKYLLAKEYVTAKDFDSATLLFTELGKDNFKDSQDLVEDTIYKKNKNFVDTNQATLDTINYFKSRVQDDETKKYLQNAYFIYGIYLANSTSNASIKEINQMITFLTLSQPTRDATKQIASLKKALVLNGSWLCADYYCTYDVAHVDYLRGEVTFWYSLLSSTYTTKTFLPLSGIEASSDMEWSIFEGGSLWADEYFTYFPSNQRLLYSSSGSSDWYKKTVSFADH